MAAARRGSLQAAAAAADDYDRGVWWVPLASLADPALVETAAAQALGSKDTLSATVGDKRLLLVLDNFEHLLEAAAGVAETIGSCPHLTVLVTSREPLHVDGEWRSSIRCESGTQSICSCSVLGRQFRLCRKRRGRRDLQAPRLPAARDRTGCA